MIKHIVLMKMNDELDDKTIAGMRDYAARIREQIAEARSYDIVLNEASGSKGYDWAILATFATASDIQSYKAAPLHREFVAYCDPYTEDFLTLDYQVAEPI